MRFPAISGVIDRRILINFNIDPDVVQRCLPPPFKPKTHGDRAIAGICLIRLKHVRPKGMPGAIGIASENGAHRIAVEWAENGVLREGVFVPRRDTSSRINSLAGGRVFPGVHHRSRFIVNEGSGHYSVEFRSQDGTSLRIKAQDTDQWNASSVFPSLEAASGFMERGSFGFSPTGAAGCFHGLELRTSAWHVTPLEVSEVGSSFFSDRSMFPEDSIRFDGAMLMRGIGHEWHAAPALRPA